MFARCTELGLAASVSIFDPSNLRVMLAFRRAGALPHGALVKLYFGGQIPFGLPPARAGLDAYLAMLEGSGLGDCGRSVATAAETRAILGLPA